MRRFLIVPILMFGATGVAYAQSLSGLVRSLSVQVPEPGMLLLFGLGAGVLGVRMGRKK